MNSAHENREYRCTPDVKHECTTEGCEKITGDFKHAESFAYNPETSEISACLWTNCYAATAVVFRDPASGSFTAFGRLMPTAHPGNEPIIVSLTIRMSGNAKTTDGNGGSFTAIWGYGTEGLTLDMGNCVL